MYSIAFLVPQWWNSNSEAEWHCVMLYFLFFVAFFAVAELCGRSVLCRMQVLQR